MSSASVPVDAALLLRHMADGSESALREFYGAFHGRVYAFALQRLKNPADAADVLNEVMLEVWRAASRFEGRSQVLTWVLGITHHKVVDTLRRRKEPLQEEIDPDLFVDESQTASEAIIAIEDADQLHRCIGRLSDAHRLVVHLAFFEDLSYEEIARVADCPVGTVKTRMLHAKQYLKRFLLEMNRQGASADLQANLERAR